MNTSREQVLTSVAPLILRLGLAFALALDGLARLGAFSAGDTTQALAATASGLQLSLSWSTLAGGAELLVAATLAIGFLTRLALLPILAAVALAAFRSWNPALENGMAAPTPEFLGARGPALALLVTTCLALLVSGCGSLGLDRRFSFNRRKRDSLEAAS